MTTDPDPLRADEIPPEEPTTQPQTPPVSPMGNRDARFTRASAVWVSTGVALLLLILLIVFILQNSSTVDVHFFGLDGAIPLGVALLIAAVAGGVLVAIAGIVRITQLRISAHRLRRAPSND